MISFKITIIYHNNHPPYCRLYIVLYQYISILSTVLYCSNTFIYLKKSPTKTQRNFCPDASFTIFLFSFQVNLHLTIHNRQIHTLHFLRCNPYCKGRCHPIRLRNSVTGIVIYLAHINILSKQLQKLGTIPTPLSPPISPGMEE